MRTLLYPWWFLQIFTTAKSFKTNPILGNERFNRWGLHRARVQLAHHIMYFRMRLLSKGISPEDRSSYEMQGYILKENALPTALFEAIETEIRHYHGEIRECQQGDTWNQHIALTPNTLKNLPNTEKWLQDSDVKQLFSYTAGHKRQPLCHIEHIKHGQANSQSPDPQKDLHVDTFHPTMKFWLFLDDVTLENGPFTYIPQSQRLSKERLAWETRLSCIASKHSNYYTARGSFRVECTDDLVTMNLPPLQKFTVKKNTLLIANTFGIHARGQAHPNTNRLAIWGMSRTNPFLPFTGSGFKIFDELQYNILEILRNQADLKAARKGWQAPWRKA